MLHAQTTENVVLAEVILCKFLPAKPAPLVIASRARDVITTALFPLSTCFALGTIHKVCAALGILKEFFFMLSNRGFLLARAPGVPLRATLETHLKATSTNRRLTSLFALFDVADAVWERAPAQRGVQVHNNVLVELQVLCVDILATEFTNVFICIYLSAAILHARDLQHAALGNFDLQMVLNAILAL